MEPIATSKLQPVITVEHVTSALSAGDIQDLCDGTDAAIEAGGGFGWVELPARDVLERFWQGVVTMPGRLLMIARLDGVIAGTVQLVKPPVHNEAQSFACHLQSLFVAPWARDQGLAKLLMQKAEEVALDAGFAVINLDIRETQDAAMALFESLGYQRVGRHPVYARVRDQLVSGRYYYKVIDPRALAVST